LQDESVTFHHLTDFRTYVGTHAGQKMPDIIRKIQYHNLDCLDAAFPGEQYKAVV
jgi:hypothetical protein